MHACKQAQAHTCAYSCMHANTAFINFLYLFVTIIPGVESHLPMLDVVCRSKASEGEEAGPRAAELPTVLLSTAFSPTHTAADAPSAWKQDSRTFNSALPSSMWPSPLTSLGHFSSFLSSTWFSSFQKDFSSLLSSAAMRKSSLQRVSIEPSPLSMPLHWTWATNKRQPPSAQIQHHVLCPAISF